MINDEIEEVFKSRELLLKVALAHFEERATQFRLRIEREVSEVLSADEIEEGLWSNLAACDRVDELLLMASSWVD